MIRFRKAEMSDLHAIVETYKACIDSMYAEGIDQWDIEWYPTAEVIESDIMKGEMIVGTKDDDIVSAATINGECDEQYAGGEWVGGDDFVVIHRLCVSPRHQRQGIARQTMQYIENGLSQAKNIAIRLDVFTLNNAALRLYERLGYQKRGEALWLKGRFNLYEKTFNI